MSILTETADRKRLAADIIDAAVEQGWTRHRGTKHDSVIAPNGQRHNVYGTGGDHRAMLNIIAQMRRNGFIWPWNKKDSKVREHVRHGAVQHQVDNSYRLAEYSQKIREAEAQARELHHKLELLKYQQSGFQASYRQAVLMRASTNDDQRKEGERNLKLLSKIYSRFEEIPTLEKQIRELESKINSWMKVVGEVQSASPDEPKQNVLSSRQRRINALASKVTKGDLTDMLDRKQGMGATKDEVATYLTSQYPDLGNVTSLDVSGLIKHYGLIIPRGRIPGKRYQ